MVRQCKTYEVNMMISTCLEATCSTLCQEATGAVNFQLSSPQTHHPDLGIAGTATCRCWGTRPWLLGLFDLVHLKNFESCSVNISKIVSRRFVRTNFQPHQSMVFGVFWHSCTRMKWETGQSMSEQLMVNSDKTNSKRSRFKRGTVQRCLGLEASRSGTAGHTTGWAFKRFQKIVGIFWHILTLDHLESPLSLWVPLQNLGLFNAF